MSAVFWRINVKIPMLKKRYHLLLSYLDLFWHLNFVIWNYIYLVPVPKLRDGNQVRFCRPISLIFYYSLDGLKRGPIYSFTHLPIYFFNLDSWFLILHSGLIKLTLIRNLICQNGPNTSFSNPRRVSLLHNIIPGRHSPPN